MDCITMSKKERVQLVIFDRLKQGEIRQVEAAAQLKVSTRWVRQKLKRYYLEGERGLVHRNRGRVSNRRWKQEEQELLLTLLRGQWHDFGPTFIARKLRTQHGIQVSRETVRQTMLRHGLWQAGTQKVRHRAWRRRKAMRGIMIQLDGSRHDWFEGRGPMCTLLAFIDDATSQVMWLEFAASESLTAVMTAQLKYLQLYGAPQSIYVDYGSVFSVNTNNPERTKITQFERALIEVNIELIHARSPQAKGRVERLFATLQDHLPKELRLAGVATIAAANHFLQESNYLQQHNQLFAVPPALTGDAHRSVADYNLQDSFCIKEQRVVANDFTVCHQQRILQVTSQQLVLVRPKDLVNVHTHLDGSLSLHLRGHSLAFQQVGTRLRTRLSPVDYVNLARPFEHDAVQAGAVG